MMRRNRVRVVLAATLLTIGGFLAPRVCAEEARPNIVWITCEDMSPLAGCYGDPVARTPNIDGMAAQGLRYENAFSISGVCAPSRSCLITGMYPTSLGTCHMRCRNQPPDYVKCFPEYLQKAGYYCTNNRKEDYNFHTPPTAWNESSNKAHFRNRPDKDQPFFAVFNFTITHESKIGTLPEDLSEGERELLLPEKTDPQSVTLPAVYPDTPVIRKHWAHFYDLIAAMDRQVGEILNQLEEDGLTDNTIVFFYADHGTGAPLFKRWLWDRGTRVPLIIKWPGKIEPGSVTDRLVSFVDFGPTVLSLAGVPIPEYMQGKAFLGEQETPERDFVYAARDRMDERLEIIRSARDKRYRYIRNYKPEVPYDQYLNYPESFPIMQDLRRAHDAGELNEVQLQYFADRKPLEELYDLETDPEEIQNIAGSAEHREDLNRLRGAVDDWMARVHDVGFIPEFQLEEWLNGGGRYPNPDEPYAKLERRAPDIYGRSTNDWIDRLNGKDRLQRLEAAKVLGLVAPAVTDLLTRALKDPDPGVAYWAGVGLGNAQSESVVTALEDSLSEEAWGRKLGAATGLVGLGHLETALPIFEAALGTDNEYLRLYAIQVLEGVGPEDPMVKVLLKKGLEDESNYVVRCAHHGLGMPPKR
ncbi:MAG: sulfatase-like hydrolase/transferase [Candidatus Omnitrophica bacterium]|nr:sulfatase-like hydrolase/transferase [Candidatus Omnitrophota bacterium]